MPKLRMHMTRAEIAAAYTAASAFRISTMTKRHNPEDPLWCWADAAHTFFEALSDAGVEGFVEIEVVIFAMLELAVGQPTTRNKDDDAKLENRFWKMQRVVIDLPEEVAA